MRRKYTPLHFFLDECVPDSVGRVLRAAGHQVTLLRESGIATGSPDAVVCTMAEIKGAILVSFDGDMRVLAQGHGVTASRFKKLSILKLSCFEPDAADRVKSALSLIDHEWRHNKASKGDRIFIDIGKSIIRTCR